MYKKIVIDYLQGDIVKCIKTIENKKEIWCKLGEKYTIDEVNINDNSIRLTNGWNFKIIGEKHFIPNFAKHFELVSRTEPQN